MSYGFAPRPGGTRANSSNQGAYRAPAPFTPEQERARAMEAENDAYSRWLTQQNLMLQLAGQQRDGRAQEVYNSNQLASLAQQQAALGYGLGQDIASANLSLGRGQVDLAGLALRQAQMQNDIRMQQENNRRYGFGLNLDLARARGQERAGPGATAARLLR